MKVFISYCQDNGGLRLAERATKIFESKKKNHCWYYERDKTVGADRYDEIRFRITEWCDCVIFLCTNGSAISVGQTDEIVFAREWRITIIPVCIDKSKAPSTLSRDRVNYEDIDSGNFIQEFDNRVVRRLPEMLKNYRNLGKRVIAKKIKIVNNVVA